MSRWLQSEKLIYVGLLLISLASAGQSIQAQEYGGSADPYAQPAAPPVAEPEPSMDPSPTPDETPAPMAEETPVPEDDGAYEEEYPQDDTYYY